ncbi:hypothetical protein GG344DRAFT_84721 [Lentinula edodes]|nr:hypothetical protein GG344DRAFT_84721 [Lentinula edodes]
MNFHARSGPQDFPVFIVLSAQVDLRSKRSFFTHSAYFDLLYDHFDQFWVTAFTIPFNQIAKLLV